MAHPGFGDGVKIPPLSAAEEAWFGGIMGRITSTDEQDVLPKLGPSMEHKSTADTMSKVGYRLLPRLGDGSDLPEHAVAFILVLAHSVPECTRPAAKDFFLAKASDVLSMAPSFQLRAMPSLVGIIVDAVARFAMDRDCSRAMLRPLRRAALQTAPHPRCLTPAHGAYAMLACHNKMYKDVCALADLDIVEVQPKEAGLSVESILAFFFYAGCSYAALKRWGSAVDAFAATLVVPSSALSSVSIAAYKRRLLCGLISRGKAPQPPRAVEQGALTGAARASAAYDRIATAFASADTDTLPAAIVAAETELVADGLAGLARQLPQAQRRHRIIALTGTFVTVPLGELAAKVGLPDAAAAEEEVFELVRAGMLRARVDQERGIVRFLDDDVTADPARLVERIESLVGAAVALSEAVAEREASLVLSADFIGHAAAKAQREAEVRRVADRGARGPAGMGVADIDADTAEAMARSMA